MCSAGVDAGGVTVGGVSSDIGGVIAGGGVAAVEGEQDTGTTPDNYVLKMFRKTAYVGTIFIL